MMTLTENEFYDLSKYIESTCGISLGVEKSYLIETRLSRLLEATGICSFNNLCSMIRTKAVPGPLSEKIVDAITTNETLWFRDKAPWAVLEDRLTVEYLEDLRSGRKSSIKIWSAGCSTGQEPYSIAMYIDNYLEQHNIQDLSLKDFEIIATDISTTALATAEAGIYDNIAVSRGLPDLFKSKYFHCDNKLWRIDKKIQRAVNFKRYNLQNSFKLMEKIDVIFCRYVLIYFSNTLKNNILQKIAECLNPKGMLILGSSELYQDYAIYFEMKNYRDGIYYEVCK
jgi:chemotaxis protein methyltransferase CheR